MIVGDVVELETDGEGGVGKSADFTCDLSTPRKKKRERVGEKFETRLYRPTCIRARELAHKKHVAPGACI